MIQATLARAEGNAEYARQWWPLLTRWAQYLREKGMDPDNQLNTDDFAGHSAHNANLSLKAIVALAAYAAAPDAGLGPQHLARGRRHLRAPGHAGRSGAHGSGDHRGAGRDGAMLGARRGL